MTAKVFISYRREDSAAYAGRIQDRLERELGRDLLFLDVDDIPLGVNFVKVLREEVAQCGVLLAVIGPNWLGVRDEDGTRRLDNPTDVVRIEIAAALQREIPVIPILLDGTRVPKADQLPEDLKELALRNGLNVRHASFHADLDKLIRELKRQVAAARLSDAQALLNKGRTLGELRRREEAIAVYDDLIARFGNATELALREHVVLALLDKGNTLGELRRREEAIAVYDDLLARVGNATELALRERVALALLDKGNTLRGLRRREEAIAVYDDLIARFGNATELALREHVVMALLNKGNTLGELRRREEAIAVYDDLIAGFGNATELALREHVVLALLNKGNTLGELRRREEAIAVYDNLIARFGNATELLRQWVANAKSARDRLKNSEPTGT